MDCPFSLEMAENEEDEDPAIDKDEEKMSEKKKETVEKVDGFSITKKLP